MGSTLTLAILVGMARVLVTEELAPSGLDTLRSAGHDVDVQLGLDPVGLAAALVGADALIVRSATQVTADALAATDSLQVVGRAGVGLDNVDVAAATAAGVMVVNAPLSNIVSAAEQTLALILAQARNTPQAHAALVQGRWERSKWTGMELQGKTLGIIGLGRIGKLVAERALGFGLHLVGYDPFVSPERAKEMSVELMGLDELAARADIITVHVAKTPETVGLINTAFLDGCKDGVRIINVARGGIVDEVDLPDAVRSGKVGAAGLDVFVSEPCTDSPLFELPNVVVTPHLGASTREAQDKAGQTIAEQVNLALAGEFVPFAVNIDAAEVAGPMKPFVALAEKLGALFGALFDELPGEIELRFEGEIGGFDNSLATLAAAKGVLAASVSDPISYVNAGQMLAERGVSIQPSGSAAPRDYVDRLTILGGGRRLSATLIGLRNEARIVRIDDHHIDLPISDHLLVVRNDDRPGMIGIVTSILGRELVNIDDMSVGRDDTEDSAIMVISTARAVDEAVTAEIADLPGILSVDRISLG